MDRLTIGPVTQQDCYCLTEVTIDRYTIVVSTVPHGGRGVLRTGWVRAARTLGLSHDQEYRLVCRALEATQVPAQQLGLL